MESAIGLDLLLELIEFVADEFGDFATPQARDVDVIFPQFPLIVMTLAVEVHKVEFVNEAVALEQAQGAIDRAAVDARIEALRFSQNLAGVQMLVSGFDDAQDRTPLLGHANAALREVRLQTSGNFGLRKRHDSRLAFTCRKWSQLSCDEFFRQQ